MASLDMTPAEEKMFLEELKDVVKYRNGLKNNVELHRLLDEMMKVAVAKADDEFNREFAENKIHEQKVFSSMFEEEMYYLEQDNLYWEMLSDKRSLARVTAIDTVVGFICKSESVEPAFTPVKEKPMQTEAVAPKKMKKSLSWFDVNGSPVISQRLFDTTEPVCVI